MKRLFLLLLLLVPVAFAAPERHREEVAAVAGERLVVELDHGGSMRVEAWDRDAVEVVASVLPAGGGRSAVDVERTERGVLVRSRAGATAGFGAADRLDLRVPRRFDLELETRAGSVEVVGVDGELWVESSGGELRFSDISGRLDAATLGGDVSVVDSRVDGRVRTNGGVIRVREVHGAIESATLGGDVIYEGESSAPGSGTLRIETHGGDIRVDRAPEGLDASTEGGDIVVEQAGGDVSLRTQGGAIRVGELSGCIQARTMSGPIAVGVVAEPRGDCDLRLTSHSGDVTLSVPADFGMEVDIRVSHARGRDARVHSDFELAIDRAPHWDYSLGAPRKLTVARGTVGSGRHQVRIEAFNGDARLLSR